LADVFDGRTLMSVFDSAQTWNLIDAEYKTFSAIIGERKLLVCGVHYYIMSI